MNVLRIGTRGSDLALRQTEWVVRQLQKLNPSVQIAKVIIKTHGDLGTESAVRAGSPLGGFVGAIEQALLRQQIDVAVHSHKDLPTAPTPGLVVAAIPEREVPHDVLVTREAADLRALPRGFRIGTGSPRRAAQFRRLGDMEIVSIRGNVPTRIAKLDTDLLDGVVLAAAGLARLAVDPTHRIDLPLESFVPAPAQGALAVQTRAQSDAVELVQLLDDVRARRAVTAERAFLERVGAGCGVPVGAFALVQGDDLMLRGQLLTTDGAQMAMGTERGTNPQVIGEALAVRLRAELG